MDPSVRMSSQVETRSHGACCSSASAVLFSMSAFSISPPSLRAKTTDVASCHRTEGKFSMILMTDSLSACHRVTAEWSIRELLILTKRSIYPPSGPSSPSWGATTARVAPSCGRLVLDDTITRARWAPSSRPWRSARASAASSIRRPAPRYATGGLAPAPPTYPTAAVREESACRNPPADLAWVTPSPAPPSRRQKLICSHSVKSCI